MSTVDVDRWVAHPPKRVWRALSEPRWASRWLPFEGYRCEVGHAFMANGPEGPVPCEVVRVDAPNAVYVAWQDPREPGEVVVSVAPERGGTRIRITHSGTSDRCYAPLLILWSSTVEGPLTTALGLGVSAGLVGTVGLASVVGLAAIGVVLTMGSTDPEPVVDAKLNAEHPVRADLEKPPSPAPPSGGARSMAPSRSLAPAEPPPRRPALLGYDHASAMRVWEQGHPRTLNPFFATTDVERRTAALMFDPMFERSPIGATIGSEVVDGTVDGAVFVLQPREGVLFHDGSPLTGADLCFSIEASLDPRSTLPQRDLGIVGCTVDDGTARVQLDGPRPDPRLLLDVPVVPAHAFPDGLDPEDGFAFAPIGTGPFEGRLAVDHVRLVARPDAGVEAPVGSLQLVTGLPADQAVEMVLEGQLDGMVDAPPSTWDVIRRSDDVALKSFGQRREVFLIVADLPDDQRRAVSAAIDHEAVRDAVYGQGLVPWAADRLTGPWLPASVFYNRAVKPHSAARGTGTLRLGGDPAVQDRLPGLLDVVGDQLADAGFTIERTADETAAEVWIVDHAWSLSEDVGALVARPGRPSAQVSALLARMEGATTDTELQDAAHDLHAQVHREARIVPLLEERGKSAFRNRVRNNTLSDADHWARVEDWTVR